jgi:hypothetical protein
MRRWWLAFLLLATAASAQSISCGSGFTSSGACGTSSTVGAASWGLYSGGSLSGSNVILVPSGAGHNGFALIYQTAVSSQAFSTTFTFVPNGYDLSLVLENNTVTGAAPVGPGFASGAGCEAGFYQSVNPGASNVFAISLDSYGNTGAGASFTYSSVQMFEQNQPPCNPANGGEVYFWGPTQKVSTSPVPLNSPSSTQGTTTGDTYSATVVYDGSTVTLAMFDVTAGGSCPGASCFTQTWSNVSIPSLVGSTTAYIGLTSGVGLSPTTDLLIKSFTFAPATATATPGSTATAAGYTTASNPTFSPVAGTYSGSQLVALSTGTSGATICYSLGSAGLVVLPAPDNLGGCAVGILYSSPVAVASTQTLYAIAGTNLTSLPSGVARAAYTITANGIPTKHIGNRTAIGNSFSY